jgi:hypothetical protein
MWGFVFSLETDMLILLAIACGAMMSLAWDQIRRP